MRWLASRAATAGLLVLAALPAATGAQRSAGPVVRFPIPRDDGRLTPYTFENAYPLVTLVYDTLTWRDEKGVPRPWLARSIRRGGDGRTVTVRLRSGVRWHDGRPLTAADVAFTYRYMATRRHPRFTPQLRDIAAVTAVDATTLEVRLRRPSLGLLDQPFADVPILPRHLWEGLPAGRAAPGGPVVGSGPYRVVHGGEAARYVFEENRDYFMGRPTVRRIEVPIVGRADRALESLRAGRLDAVPIVGSTDALRIPGLATASGPSYLGTVLMFNLRRAPFDRVEVRRTVAAALDLGRIARAAGGGATTQGVRPADRGYLSPASPWAPRERLHEFDLATARVALAEEGVPAIRVMAPTGSPLALEAGRQVVLALRRAGARAELLERSNDALADAVGQDGADARFDVAIWGAPPLASYDPAFLRTQFETGGELNYSGYATAEFDRLSDRLDSAATPAARRAVAAAQVRRLARDLPVVPLFYADAAFAYRPGQFSGWRFAKGSGIVDKRSFMPHGEPVASPPIAADTPVDSEPRDDPSLVPYIGGGLALIVAGAGLLLFRRRRARV